MRIRNALLASTAATAAVLFQLGVAAPALAQSAAALAGKVSSAAEPVMEGVVVSAKKDGSTITVSVVTDDKGQYSFPAERLEPGHYTLSARAAGYDLDGPKAADVAGRAAGHRRHQAQAHPQPARAAHQCRMDDEHAGHGRAEVVPAQLQRLPHRRAHREVDARCRRIPADISRGWAAIIRAARRASRNGSLATCSREVGRGGDNASKTAEWLATINLSQQETWSYPLKTLPRLTGKSTHVIITEYDLPNPADPAA